MTTTAATAKQTSYLVSLAEQTMREGTVLQQRKNTYRAYMAAQRGQCTKTAASAAIDDLLSL